MIETQKDKRKRTVAARALNFTSWVFGKILQFSVLILECVFQDSTSRSLVEGKMTSKQQIVKIHNRFPRSNKDAIANLLQYYEYDDNKVIDAMYRDGGCEALSNFCNLKSKEVEDLKSKLEKEKKINKEFSSQMVRFNSLIKIVQDALTAEQEKVKKLKAQLEETPEVEDLKSKLEKERKINKEFSSQMVQLNSLVKIGQDALTAERERVKKLKAQLEETQQKGVIRSRIDWSEREKERTATFSLTDHTFLGVTGEISTILTGEVSTVVEWRITNSFPFATGVYLESPTFMLAGCEWCLRLYPKGIKNNGLVTASLRMVDSETAAKRVKVCFGIRSKGGHVNQTLAAEHIFTQEETSFAVDFIEVGLLLRESVVLVPSDTTLRCCLEVEAMTPEAVSSKASKVKPRQTKQLVKLETLSSDLEDLFVNERKCDVTIQIKDKEFRAHRAILCARSPVFRAMYDHDTSEDQTGVLPIVDCDPDSFGLFLSYIYTGRIEQESFRTAYHLYTTADKYDVQQLKSFCAEYLKQNLTAENVCDAVVLADRHSDDELMSSVHDFFNQNFRSILTTPEWTAMIRNNPRLTDKLLKVMASTV